MLHRHKEVKESNGAPITKAHPWGESRKEHHLDSAFELETTHANGQNWVSNSILHGMEKGIIFQTLKANKQISRPNNFTGFIFSQYFLKSNKPVVEKIIPGLKMSFENRWYPTCTEQNYTCSPWHDPGDQAATGSPKSPVHLILTPHSLLVCKAHTGNRKKGLALYSLLQSCQGTNLSCRWSAPPTSLHPPSWCWWWPHPRWWSAHRRAGPGNQTPLWPPLEGKETKRAT